MEIVSSPRSPPPKYHPLPGSLFSQQVVISVGVRQMKHPRVDSGGLFGLPPQSSLALVYSDLQGTCVCLGSGRNRLLTRGLVGSITLSSRRGHCVRGGGAVLMRPRDMVPLSKKARPWSFLPVSTQ
jgi:hypothetical protein